MSWSVILLLLCLCGLFIGARAEYKEGKWSACNATCSEPGKPAFQFQITHCADPRSSACNHSSINMHKCDVPECAKHGSWSDWSGWSACSVLCFGGVRRQFRACDNPKPSNGGRYCDGGHEKLETCNSQPCPGRIDFTKWTAWTQCPQCHRNINRTRKRECYIKVAGSLRCPSPQSLTEVEPCPFNYRICPIDGGWSSWSEWTPCPVTKDCSKSNGTVLRQRECNNPTPRRGGKGCEGATKEEKQCSTWRHDCPVDGWYSDWGQWVYNHTTSERVRYRNCTEAKNGGKTCKEQGLYIMTETESFGESGSGSGSGSDSDGDTGSGSGDTP